MKGIRFSSALVVFIILIISGKLAYASAGLTISPAKLDLVLVKNNSIANTAVSVKNDYDRPVTMDANLLKVDVQSDNLTPSNEPSELAKFITITPKELIIEPGQSKNFKVELTDDPSLSPGGHYAALQLKYISTPSNQLNLGSAIRVNIFMVKQDGSITKLSHLKLKSNGWLFARPKSANINLKNDGNVYAVPRASFSVYSPLKKLSASGVINEGSLSIYPGNNLNFNGKLIWEGFTWMPGRYKITAKYRAQNGENYQTAINYFWYIPPYLILVVLVTIIGVYKLRKKLKKRNVKIPKPAKKPAKIQDILPVKNTAPKA